MGLNLSQLIAEYGDDKVQLQNLDQCGKSIDYHHKKGTSITFGTDSPIGTNGMEKLGIVIWLDRERVAEIIEKAKEPVEATARKIEAPYPPIAIHKAEDGVDHRVGVHEYRTVDRPEGGMVTISVFLGNHTWAEAILPPDKAKLVSDMILSKPCVAALSTAAPEAAS